MEVETWHATSRLRLSWLIIQYPTHIPFERSRIELLHGLAGMFLNSDNRIQSLYKRAYEKIAKSNNTKAIQNLVDDIIAKGIQFKQFNFDKTAVNLLQQMVNFQRDSEVANRNKHIQIIRMGLTQLVN